MTRTPGIEDDEIAALEAQLARARANKQRRDEEERTRRASLPQTLVPRTPSPRKKRRTDDLPTDPTSSHSLPTRPPPPDLFAKPVLARALNPEESVYLRNATPRESHFVDHMSAVPKSFAETLAERKTLERIQQERKQRQLDRRTKIGLGELTARTTPPAFASAPARPSSRVSELKATAAAPRRSSDKDASSRPPASASAPATIARYATAPTASSSSSSLSAPSQPVQPLRDLARGENDGDDFEITDGPARRTRRKDGTLIETVQMGSREFVAPEDDPSWERVEPYSGIRLRERVLPHSDLDALLDGRYHLTPSQVYALARIDSRRRIDLDPEVIDSDFVVIGVLAWKDEVRFLNSGALGPKQRDGKGASSDDDDDEDKEEDAQAHGNPAEPNHRGMPRAAKGKAKAAGPNDGNQDTLFRPPSKRQRRQRYLRFELVDLSSIQASAAADGRLSVMLVQADSEDKAVDADGNQVSVYKGQSGGAFEKFWKETPGAVVAMINPTFLPHNKNFSYTLKPTSADSMVVIGRAENLTFCEAVKADGKRCGQWVDARMGKVCQFHVERAIQRTGVRRAETNANTASLSTQGTFSRTGFTRSLGSRPGGPSPATRTSMASGRTAGSRTLSPPPSASGSARIVAGSTTYVTRGTGPSGNTISSSRRPPGQTLLGRPGAGFLPGVREGPSVSEEKKRRLRQVEEDRRARRELKALVGLDQGKTPGGQYLALSRQRQAAAAGGEAGCGAKGDNVADGDDNGGEEEEGERKRKGSQAGSPPPDPKRTKHGIFRPEALRKIGYNPAFQAGDPRQREETDDTTRRHRLSLQAGHLDRNVQLSAPRKKKESKKPPARGSTGVVPAHAAGAAPVDDGEEEDDLLIEGAPLERVKVVLPPLPLRKVT